MSARHAADIKMPGPMNSRRRSRLPYYGVLFAVLLLAAVGFGIYWFTQGTSFERWIDEGNARIGRGEYEAAAESFENAVKASPDNEDGWRWLADATCRAGKPGRSQEALEALAQRNQAHRERLLRRQVPIDRKPAAFQLIKCCFADGQVEIIVTIEIPRNNRHMPIFGSLQ